MIRIALTFAMLLALGHEASAQTLALAQAQTAVTPRLKELVTVTSDVVRIGDLVENAGAAADIAGVPRARPRPDRLRAGRRASPRRCARTT